jgi:hypothetical protein
MFIATDAYRILRRLGFEVESDPAPPPEKVTLELQAIGWVRDGPIFGRRRLSISGLFRHMPVGYQALIANFGAPHRNDWKIMRIDDDMQEDWNGHLKKRWPFCRRNSSRHEGIGEQTHEEYTDVARRRMAS